MKKQRIMPNLPQEIISEILSRLPVKPLTKFKTVSKSWQTLISSPYFINSQHLNQMIHKNHVSFILQQEYSFHPLAYESSTRRILLDGDNPVDVLATCNGLFCVSNLKDEFFLWNPSTTQTQKIPTSTIEFPSHSTWASVFFGLGHHSASDDYKLVRVSVFGTIEFRTEVKIYSRNTNAWRRIGDFPYECPVQKRGVYARGRMHWLVSSYGSNSYEICALDLEDESYGLIKLPEDASRATNYFHDIGALNENLIFFSSLNNCLETYGLWILQEYGKPESWTRIKIAKEDWITDEQRFRFEPLCLLKPNNDEILFRTEPAGRLVVYDLKKKRCSGILAVPKMEDKWSAVFCFVESLVSPIVH